jgi:hypothetical protein
VRFTGDGYNLSAGSASRLSGSEAITRQFNAGNTKWFQLMRRQAAK